MERVFANLYRFSGSPIWRGVSHSYLLLRKEGNLLVCHRHLPAVEEFDEIERLGGIESQWICHHHDTNDAGLHDKLQARFGCALHHHRIDRTGVRKKTKCPFEQFGDDGVQHGSDFEALFFPSCTGGHSIYRWRSRGKHFLFSSHAIYMRDKGWDLQFHPGRASRWRPQLDTLAKMQVDYLFPGYVPEDEGVFYRLNEQTRKSLSTALKRAGKN